MSRSAFKPKKLISRKTVLMYGSTCLFFILLCGVVFAQTPAADSLDAGFRHMYNRDFQTAHQIFENWQQQHPDDARGAAANAAAYLFCEFDRLQILEAELFTDTDKLKDRGKLTPDPEVKAVFESELAKAEQIAEEVLSKTSDAKDALFAQVLVNGLRADYAGLIEK